MGRVGSLGWGHAWAWSLVGLVGVRLSGTILTVYSAQGLGI